MASVRVTPRLRTPVRASAPSRRSGSGSSAIPVAQPSPKVDEGELPPIEQPENFKKCNNLELFVVAERHLTPVTDFTHLAVVCFDCDQPLRLSRPSLPPGWDYRCPDCADKHVTGARSWVDCIYSVLLNLQEIFEDEKNFHHREEICEYINSHWRPLCGTRERTATWWKTVLTTLSGHRSLFEFCSVTDRIGSSGSSTWTFMEYADVPTTPVKPRSRPKRAAPQMKQIPLEDEDEIELQVSVSLNKKSKKGRERDRNRTRNRAPTLAQRAHLKLDAQDETRRMLQLQKSSRKGVSAERGCHHCKVVRPGLLRCSAIPEELKSETPTEPAEPIAPCTRKFCANCVEKYEVPPLEEALYDWPCLVCRGLCRCARCVAVVAQAAAEQRAVRKSKNGRRERDRTRDRHRDRHREMKKRRTADFDIFKVVYNGVPMENVRIASVSAKEIALPTWRSSESSTPPKSLPKSPKSPKGRTSPVPPPVLAPSPRSRKRGAAAVATPPLAPPAAAVRVADEESSGEESTDDAAFEERHRRAADRLRNEMYPGKDPNMTRV